MLIGFFSRWFEFDFILPLQNMNFFIGFFSIFFYIICHLLVSVQMCPFIHNYFFPKHILNIRLDQNLLNNDLSILSFCFLLIKNELFLLLLTVILYFKLNIFWKAEKIEKTYAIIFLPYFTGRMQIV